MSWTRKMKARTCQVVKDFLNHVAQQNGMRQISPFISPLTTCGERRKAWWHFVEKKTSNVGNLPSLPHIWRPWSCELWCSRCRSWRKWLIALLGRVCDAKNNITWTNFQISQMISGYRSISPGQNIKVGHGGTGQLQLLFLIRQKVSKEILRLGLKRSGQCVPGLVHLVFARVVARVNCPGHKIFHLLQ